MKQFVNSSLIVRVFYVLTLVFSLSIQAQEEFSDIDILDDVSAVVVNKKMFEMIGNVKVESEDPETQKYLSLINNLDYLKVYTSDSALSSKKMAKSFISHVNSTGGLEELMRVQDKDEVVKIYAKQNQQSQEINQMVMFVNNKNSHSTSIIVLKGVFKLEDLDILTKKLNIPSSEHLSKSK